MIFILGGIGFSCAHGWKGYSWRMNHGDPRLWLFLSGNAGSFDTSSCFFFSDFLFF